LQQERAGGQRWSVMEASVFELPQQSLGLFDVVYSWGVLHHTGDMYRALRSAAGLVAAGGQFIFALYRRTHLCWFWKLEKRWYAHAGEIAQARTRALYVGLFRFTRPLVAFIRPGVHGTFDSYVAEYRQNRGMDFYHDVHDWLGGWPYESISPAETDRFMQQLGLRRVRAFVHQGRSTGLFGSGCDEYVYGKA
jgi:2-polyprenyl-6-hydroxyphenyl methylase/3-demethylubiquinone-9 3-methyltransferase